MRQKKAAAEAAKQKAAAEEEAKRQRSMMPPPPPMAPKPKQTRTVTLPAEPAPPAPPAKPPAGLPPGFFDGAATSSEAPKSLVAYGSDDSDSDDAEEAPAAAAAPRSLDSTREQQDVSSCSLLLGRPVPALQSTTHEKTKTGSPATASPAPLQTLSLPAERALYPNPNPNQAARNIRGARGPRQLATEGCDGGPGAERRALCAAISDRADRDAQVEG